MANIDEWKWKLSVLLRNEQELEIVSRDKRDRRDFEQISNLARRMGLHWYAIAILWLIYVTCTFVRCMISNPYVRRCTFELVRYMGRWLLQARSHFQITGQTLMISGLKERYCYCILIICSVNYFSWGLRLHFYC